MLTLVGLQHDNFGVYCPVHNSWTVFLLRRVYVEISKIFNKYCILGKILTFELKPQYFLSHLSHIRQFMFFPVLSVLGIKHKVFCIQASILPPNYPHPQPDTNFLNENYFPNTET